MSFSDIVGHDKEIAILKRAITTGRLPHAYIFAGVEGIGKRLVASELARALNCTGESRAEACGECKACLSLDNGTLLNFTIIEPEGGYLKIERIRELKRTMQFKVESGTRVIVVEGADTLQKKAANAFLKTLEEPAPGTVIVLVTARPSLLLQTIMSRCQKLNFRPLSVIDIKSLLMRKFDEISEETATRIAPYGMGSFGRAIEVYRGSINKSLTAVEELLRAATAGTSLEGMALAMKLSKDAELNATLWLLKVWIRDCIVVELGSPGLAIGRAREGEFLEVASARSESINALMEAYAAVEKVLGDIKAPRNANKQLSLEVMFAELAKRGQIINAGL